MAPPSAYDQPCLVNRLWVPIAVRPKVLFEEQQIARQFLDFGGFSRIQCTGSTCRIAESSGASERIGKQR
jgi:hypothetical protein